MTVPEERIEEAIGLLAEVEKTVAEGAGAAALAALLHRPDLFAGRRVGLVLTGATSTRACCPRCSCAAWSARAASPACGWRPTTCPAACRHRAVIGAPGGNLVEVAHQRLLSAVPLRRVDVDLLVETLDAAHLAGILAHLTADGHAVTLVDP